MMNRHAVTALFMFAAAVAACDKNGRQDITAPAAGAAVKFFNFGVGAPGVNFYANTQKMTAISSTSCQPPNDTLTVCRNTGIESTVGTGYGAAGSGGLYTQVAPGSVTLAGKIAATTDNGLAIASVPATLASGKFYSYYVSGVYDATGKKADAFVVEDPIPTTLDQTTAYVRFVNAVYNGGATQLSVKNQTTTTSYPIGAAVAYESAGAFTPIPGGVYDLSATIGAAVITRTSVSFSAGHVYTVTARGDAVSTVTANKPAFDNTANR